MNTNSQDMVNDWMKDRKFDLVEHLKIGNGPRERLEHCDDDTLKYFLAEIIIPAEEYEIASIIVSIMESRGVFEDE